MIAQKPIPWIHQTDLFRPHLDPDDHWDLSCVYALADMGAVDLKGIVIDYPPSAPEWAAGRNPDAIAIAQMNYLHRLTVPFVTGSATSARSLADISRDAQPYDGVAAEFVLRTLRDSSEPVAIHIVGSSADIAMALNSDADLFARKCAGIYLNAGLGAPEPEPSEENEWNVQLNPASYASIFNAPCPLYWLPCFYAKHAEFTQREYGTWWSFLQGDVLRHMSPMLQRYFACALSRHTGIDWLAHLLQADVQQVLDEQAGNRRHMWSTAGFFHAAGYTVNREGLMVPREEAGNAVLFGFEPIDVTCDSSGRTRWTPAKSDTNRYIMRIYDIEAYPTAMTTAMKTLLCGHQTAPEGC